MKKTHTSFANANQILVTAATIPAFTHPFVFRYRIIRKTIHTPLIITAETIKPARIPSTSRPIANDINGEIKPHGIPDHCNQRLLSDKATGSFIFLIMIGRNTTDNPKIVGTDQKINSPPPFMRSTKYMISNKAKIPIKILLNNLFLLDVNGTTVNAPVRSIDAVNTQNTPNSPPLLTDTQKVITMGITSNNAITTPALYAAFFLFRMTL